MLARFGALHPGLVIELVNDTKVFNLARREADLAFRFGSFAQENLAERRIGEIAYALYASESYLERHGSPEAANSFSGHLLVLLDRAAGEVPHEAWLPALAHGARIVLHANGLHAHLAVVRSGTAMAVLPCLLADREPSLRRVAVPHPGVVRAVRVGFHSDMRDTPRIRALVNFMVLEFASMEEQLHPQG